MSISTCLFPIVVASTMFFRTLPLEKTGLNVATICQDSMGNMWYGGIDGLTMYDGKRYSYFKYEADLKECDPDSHIYKLLCDKEGLVWAAHISGLSVFDSTSRSFESFPSPEGSITDVVQISHEYYLIIAGNKLWLFDYGNKVFSRDAIPDMVASLKVTTLFECNNDIYIGTDDEGVYLTSKQFSNTRIIADVGCKVNSILKDGDYLWVGTEGSGLWEVSGQPAQVENGSRDIVKSLCLDRNGLLWIGTKNGLKILEDGQFHTFHYDYYTLGSISHDSISDIFMDWQGTMWLGTYYGGVCYCTPHSSQFATIVSRPGSNELSGNVISDISEDKDGSLWIGTNSGGLNHMCADGSFEHIPSGGENPVDVKCIYISPVTGRIYVGADRSEILLLDRRKGMLTPLGKGGPQSFYGCYAIVDNQHGGFYAGGNDGLYEFDEKSGHFSKIYISEDISNIKSMMLDSKGILWIGKKYGVSALDTKTGSVVVLPSTMTSIQYVETFLEDESGNIWMGSNSGVYVYDVQSGRIDHYSEREGLPSHVIHGMEMDSTGTVWVSTDNGLCRLDPASGSTWTFTTADGLLDNRFTGYSHCMTEKGLMYFGSLHGIIAFDPLSITMHSEMVAPLVSGVEVNGIWRSITGNQLVLRPNERDVTFILSCPDYISVENGRFFYKLVGVDDDWCEAGEDWRAVYLALWPGDYTFQLRYRNSAGEISDSQVAYRVRLRAPWYKTSASKIIIIILSIMSMLALFVWLLSRKDKEYKAQFEQERSDLLRSFSLEFVKIGAGKTADKESVVSRNYNKTDVAFISQAMNVVKNNIDNPEFTIDDFAAKMLMSRSNLNIRVKALFGVSPLDFIKTIRFNEACRLLQEEKYNVSEISYKVGFATPSYFTAAFRHFMGCTPREWLKTNKKE